MTKDKSVLVLEMTNASFEQAFQNEDDCKSYLAANRWPEEVTCPRCGNVATEHGTMTWHWNCYKCTKNGLSYRFSVKAGTLFENSNKPLRTWFRVMHMILAGEKGISARQVYRTMGVGSYATALNMCRKIRAATDEPEFNQLFGCVAVSECAIGDMYQHKDWNGRHWPIVVTQHIF